MADLNQAAAQSFGPFDAAKAAVLDRRAYFDDHDIEVFVTQADLQRLSYVAVPVGFAVSESGEVVLPEPDPGAYSAPAFDGPWGTATTAFFTATNTDGGGVSCGNTTARTILRASWLPLVDRSTSRDYWGVDLAAVAEVTGTSRCNDYVDGARIGFRSTTPGAAVVAEDPVSGRTQACATRRVTVGASWGGVSGSVAQDFTHCERIGVSGALQPATTTRLVIFDNNGSCHAGDQPVRRPGAGPGRRDRGAAGPRSGPRPHVRGGRRQRRHLQGGPVLTAQGSRRATLVATRRRRRPGDRSVRLLGGDAVTARPGRPVPMVAVDHRLFSLSWEGDDVCLHGPYPTLPACLPVDVRSTEAVLSALLEPLDAAADLLRGRHPDRRSRSPAWDRAWSVTVIAGARRRRPGGGVGRPAGRADAEGVRARGRRARPGGRSSCTGPWRWPPDGAAEGAGDGC